jgi:ribosomal protein S18 acetylase RimI-like enzyme
MQIRPLNKTDTTVYQALRLRGLKEHPEAFLAAYEEEHDAPLDQVAQRLAAATPDDFYLGAFLDGMLVGVAHFERQRGVKIQHRAYIGAMYVVPEARGHGIGRGLIDYCLEHARTLPDLEEVGLWVIIGNENAQKLYESAGFETFAIEPRALKIGDRYYDAAGMLLRFVDE